MTRGLLDTSVLIDLVQLSPETLPEEAAISVATLAELHTGVLLASTRDARLARARFVRQVEALYQALVIDADTARTYAHLADASRSGGRSPRRRVMDLWIAATAVRHRLPLYTRNAKDFAGLTALIPIHIV
jgi:predicted nucleic acid-binding protein